MDADSTILLLFACALIGYALGGLGAAALGRRDAVANAFAFGLAALSSLCGLVAGALALLGGQTTSFALLPTSIPLLATTVTLDPLSAFFVLTTSLLGLALSIYSFGYARGFHGKKNVGLLGCFYNWLLLSITLVFCADNALFFVLVWELMSLIAYCLVCFDHDSLPRGESLGLHRLLLRPCGWPRGWQSPR